MPVAGSFPEPPQLPNRYRVPGASPPKGGAPRVAALDGVRGIAIAAVVAFHAGVLPGGFLGVDLFFVLSGFLITNLLLREVQLARDISLRQFWTRRARRLVPAVLALVAVTQVWARTHAGANELSVINGQSAAAMVYGSNWFNILFDVGYWSVGPGNSPLNHLWSLAIEEQFYIVFPMLLFVAMVRGKMRTRAFAWLAIFLAIVSFALTPVLFALRGANRAYFGTDTRVGAILIGVALAAWLFGRIDLESESVQHNDGTSSQRSTDGTKARVVSLFACAAMVAMAVMWCVLTTAAPALYNGSLFAHAIASVVVIAAVVLSPTAPLARALQWRPLVWLGERSYSLYLWHWPLIVIMTPSFTGLSGISLVIAIAMAICIATLVSYELVEQPIRYSKLSGARLILSFSVPALCIAASALLFQPPPPPAFGSNTLVTQGRGGLRLMLVGDSWARYLGIALAEVDSTHHMTIMNMGKGGCGIADAKVERSAEKGDMETPYACLIWTSTWHSTVQQVRPEAAILNLGNWDLTPQDFDGTGEFVGACHARFAERYSRQLDRAISILGERGARVFVMTIRDNDERENSDADCMNKLLRAAVTRHQEKPVELLDLYAQLCANHRCPQVVDGEAVYDHTGHLTQKAERRIATWVLNTVNARMAASP